MTAEFNPSVQADRKVKMNVQGGSTEAVYALGLIGARVFYIGRAGSFQEGVKGFFKGIVWPASMVYDLLTFLHKE